MKNSLNKASLKRLSQSYNFTIEDDKPSIIEKTILEISREIINSTWIPIGTKDQLEGIVNNDGYLDIPSNINDLICNYIEFVNSKD